MNNLTLNYLKHNSNRFYSQSRFYVNFPLTQCNAPLVTLGVSGALEVIDLYLYLYWANEDVCDFVNDQ